MSARSPLFPLVLALAAFFAPLVLETPPAWRTAAAHETHTHVWDPVHNLPTPIISMPTRWVEHGVVPVTLSASQPFDEDHCLNFGSVTEDQCFFAGNTARNALVVLALDAGGGEFGYLDTNGEFQASDLNGPGPTGVEALAEITHYRFPGGPGETTVSLTIDDVPFAEQDLCAHTASTFDDAPETTELTLEVVVHEHDWEQVDDIPVPGIGVGKNPLGSGRMTTLTISGLPEIETDRCLNQGTGVGDHCPFGSAGSNGIAKNEVKVTGWEGGGVGALDGNGDFYVPELPEGGIDWSKITHFVAPTVEEKTVVTLRLTLDDEPTATPPGSQEPHPTYDDGEAIAETDVTVLKRHVHDWKVEHNIPVPTVYAGVSGMFGNGGPSGDLMPLEYQVSPTEPDTCLNAAGDAETEACPISPRVNDVVLVEWSDGEMEGVFGYLDPNAGFVEAEEPDQVTHYLLPEVEGGGDGQEPSSLETTSIMVTLKVDDVPFALNIFGELEATFDDDPVLGSASFSVWPAEDNGHEHDWVEEDNIEAPEIKVLGTQGAENRVLAGKIVELEVEQGNPEMDGISASFWVDDLGADVDACIGPFEGDGGDTDSVPPRGGGQGPPILPLPPGQGGTPPGQGGTPPGGGQGPPILPVPPGQGGGQPGTLEEPEVTHTVQNAVRVIAWDDGGIGGAFGYLFWGDGDDDLEEPVFVEAAEPDEVTHYRLPDDLEEETEITLSSLWDDIPFFFDDGSGGGGVNLLGSGPSIGRLVASYDDAPVWSHALISGVPKHRHAWEENDNLEAPSVGIGSGPYQTGQEIEIGPLTLEPDTDVCLNEGTGVGDHCPFGSGGGNGNGNGGNGNGNGGNGNGDGGNGNGDGGNGNGDGDGGNGNGDGGNGNGDGGNGNGDGGNGNGDPGSDSVGALEGNGGGSGGVAQNQVTAFWDDGEAGGQFGYYDWQQQWVSEADAEFATHYRLPLLPGEYELTLTVDDIPEAQEPDGEVVETYDDEELVLTFPIDVTHEHDWRVKPELDGAGFGIAHPHGPLVPGEPIPIAVSGSEGATEADTCLNPGCSFGDPENPEEGGTAENEVIITQWSSTSGSGQFGYLTDPEDPETFQQTSDPMLVTHYLQPEAAGYVTLTATLDDVPVAIDPVTGLEVATADDPAVTVECRIRIRNPHEHQWVAGQAIPTPTLDVGSHCVSVGTLVAITPNYATKETDLCTVAGSEMVVPCSFPGNVAENKVEFHAWEGGVEFGYLDGAGNWVSDSGPDARYFIAPSSPTVLTLRFAVEDIPEAEDPATGQLEDTYPDGIKWSAPVEIEVVPDEHEHDWEPVNNLEDPLIYIGGSPKSDQVISLSGAFARYETDRCLADDDCDPPCPFGNLAFNDVEIESWASSGGAFGFLDANGEFVTTTDWDLVDHFRCPVVSGEPAQVTITLTITDVPYAEEPSGAVVETWADGTATGQLTFWVDPLHEHDWEPVDNLPNPAPRVSDSNPNTEAVIGISTGTAAQVEKDKCLAPNCWFPGGVATNELVFTWSTEDSEGDPAGGEFGALDENGTFYVPELGDGGGTDWSKVTHYKTPSSSGAVKLILTVDDIPESPHPETGEPEDTHDDAPRSAVTWLNVEHIHEFESPGNIADASVSASHGDPSCPAFPCEIIAVSAAINQPDIDLCVQPGCPFPDGLAEEIVELHRITGWASAGGGQFGRVDARGNFEPLPANQVHLITHYRAPDEPSTFNIWVVIDAPGVAQDPEDPDGVVSTIRDDPVASTPLQIIVSDQDDHCRPKSRRELGEEDAGHGGCADAPIHSSIDPGSGLIRFEVPVARWDYRGRTLGFALTYSSNSRPDALLDSPFYPDVQPHPDFAYLSERNSRWTHNFAQFVEVVDVRGSGHGTQSAGPQLAGHPPPPGSSPTYRALWHTGDGEVQAFTRQPGSDTWLPAHGPDVMVSEGTAETTVQSGEHEDTVEVPYGSFTVALANGTVYTFDQIHWQKGPHVAIPFFLLTHIEDRWGREITLNWNGNRLTGVQDGNGTGLSFQYNAAGLLEKVTLGGQAHEFAYAPFWDEYGEQRQKLVGVTVVGPGGTVFPWEFHYGSPHWPQQYGGTYTGDLVTWKKEPSGQTVDYFYEPVDLGDGESPPRPEPEDWDGRLVSAVARHPNDGGSPRQIDRDGTTLHYPGGRAVTYAFEGHNLVSVTDQLTGHQVSYTYDSQKNVTSVSHNGHQLAGIGYTYAGDGRTVLEAVVTNAAGNQVEVILGDFMEPVESTASGAGGNPDSVVKWVYDALGNPTSVTYAFDTPEEQTHTLLYESEHAPDAPTKVIDELGRDSLFVYQTGTGRLLQAHSPQNLLVSPQDPDYARSVSSVSYNAFGLPTSFTDPVGRKVNIAYQADAENPAWLWITYTRQPDQNQRHVLLSPDGLPTRFIDEQERVTSVSYNGDGQVTAVFQPGNGLDDFRYTEYRYNARRDLTRITTPEGSRIHLAYHAYTAEGQLQGDYVGQVTRIAYPDGTQVFFGYDSRGRLSWQSRPYQLGGLTLHNVIQYQYDALDRVTAVQYPASPQGVPGFTASYSYDEFGRLVSASDAHGNTGYQYDPLGRLTGVFPSGERRSLQVAYVADLTLKRWLTQTSLDGVGTWEERQDTKGRTSELVNPFGQTTAYLYNPAGDALAQLNGNGTLTEYEYTPQGWLWKIRHRPEPGAPAFDQFTYAYDVTGRLTAEVDAGGRTRQFTYDVFGQLAQETHPDFGSGIQYTYDRNGNRRQVTRNGVVEHYGVDDADKLLSLQSGLQGTDYHYDDFGQLVRRVRRNGGNLLEDLELVWDSAGRLREARRDGEAVFNATYDAHGERIAKWTTWTGDHLYSAGLHDENGDTVFTPGQSQRRFGADRFFHQDWLGSTRWLTDGDGDPQFAARYDAYGNRSATAGDDGPHPTDFLYAGAWGYQTEYADGQDAGLGLQYLYQRYYDPRAGRFISRDPIGFAGGLNLYNYTGNDPVMRIDPLGLDWLDNTANFSAAWGDVISFGATGRVRGWLGVDGVVDRCSGWYRGGQLAGTAHGLLMGGGHAGRNLVAQMGQQGNLARRTSRGFRRLFWDDRTWGQTRSTWSTAMGGLDSKGQSLHHWVFPQRANLPRGLVNAGLNYMPISKGFNSWMNGRTPGRRAVEWGFRGVAGTLELSPIYSVPQGYEALSTLFSSSSRCCS